MANLSTIYKNIFGGRKIKIKTASIPTTLIPPPQVSKEELIALLNEDIALEYTAALQYIQHYSVVQGASYDSIRDHLKEHAEQELGHAISLSDRINFMGSVPFAGVKEIKVSPDTVTMLNIDLADERVAASRYKERIVQAMSLGEFGLADILQDILKDEEEHASDLATTLGAPSGELNSAPPFVPGTQGVVTAPTATISVIPASAVPVALVTENSGALKPEGYASVNVENADFRTSREQRRQDISSKLEKLMKA